MSIRQTSVDQLPSDPTVLDVREDDEWAAGHIDGATHIPVAEVPQRLGELPDAEEIFVICRSGGRSSRVVEWLDAQGIEAINIDGGMRAWSASGRPMVSESGQEPTVI